MEQNQIKKYKQDMGKNTNKTKSIQSKRDKNRSNQDKVK